MARNLTNEIVNKTQAIKKYCMDCCCDNYNEVKACPSTTCWLYPFRLGKNPYYKPVEWTEERREKSLENLKKAREARKNQESLQ